MWFELRVGAFAGRVSGKGVKSDMCMALIIMAFVGIDLCVQRLRSFEVH